MSELNVDVPVFGCEIRKEYLYDLQTGHEEYVHATVFGLASVQGRALGFHVLTEHGAQVARLPLSALTFKEHAPHLPLHYLQLWDCFAYDVSVIDFSWLHEMRVQVILRDKQIYEGSYMFTVDWYGNNDSEEPGDDGHKNAHVIQLDCGCIAAQPNNRVLWHEPSVITSPCDLEKGQRPDYLINTHKWKCEIDSKWTTDDSYRMFYEDKLHGDGQKLDQAARIELARRRALADTNWPEENIKNNGRENKDG
jgi:hypothetical protein